MNRSHPSTPRTLATFTTLATLALLPAPARAGWPSLFRAAELYDTGIWLTSSTNRGGTPGGVAVGDLNGDHLPDLVVTNRLAESPSLARNVEVLLHSPDTDTPQLFQPKVTYPTAANPLQVAIIDMNQDGKLDVVTGSDFDSVTVLLGNGAGALGPPAIFSTGVSEISCMALADVNNDGYPDLITNSSYFLPEGISVMLGTGTGSLGTPSLYALPTGGEIYGIAVRDVTGDGAPDVVAVGNVGVAIFRGNNTGAFTYTTAPPFPAGLLALDVEVGNLNADTIPDIVVSATGFPGSGIYVYLGLGGGNYPSAGSYSLVLDPREVELGETNADGAIDIVAGLQSEDETRHSVAVLRGNGTGQFGSPTYYTGPPTFGNIRLADVDLNGKVDIVGCEMFDPYVTFRVHSASVLLDDGTGGFRSSSAWSVPGRKLLAGVVADFNRDGRNDIAFSDSTSIGMALGLGDGTFNYMLGGNLAAPSVGEIVAGEWNGDARPDIAFQQGSNVVGWYGVGTGGFSIVTFSIPGYLLYRKSVGDMNRDGRQDLVLTQYSAPSFLRIYTQAADGTFAGNTIQAASSAISSLALGDWNRDGITDVAVAMVNGISIFRGVGDGTLQAEQIVTTSVYYKDICSGDFNRDGKLDLAAIEQSPGQGGTRGITVFLGDGLGGFGGPATMSTYEQTAGPIDSWDTNVDGKSDLVVGGLTDADGSTHRPKLVEAFLGTGTGGFGSRTVYSLGAAPGAIVTGDVTRDGAPDITSTALFYNAGSLFNNFETLVATPSDQAYWLSPRFDYTMSGSANRLAIGDLNRDGILDVVASSTADPVSVRLGTGLGGFAPAGTVGSSLSAKQIGLGDMNRDGILDLMISRSGLGAPDGISFMPGLGDGTFGARADQAIAGAVDFAIGDMNKDGKPDIVVAQPDFLGSTVTVLTGNGDGTFTAMAPATVPYVYDLDLVDFNRDGSLDVVVAGGVFYIMYGNGNGTLQNSISRNVGTTSIQCVCVADFDRDGYPDVALSDITATVRVAWGSSDFVNYVVSTMPTSALDLQAGPAEADGRQFLYAVLYDNTLLLLKPGAGTGTFTTAVALPASDTPEALTLGDIDRDGLLDVVVASSTEGVVSVFLHGKSTVVGVQATVGAPVAPARLGQNVPNPFNPMTKLRYAVREPGRVQLAVFDIQGRLVATLVDGAVTAGEHEVRWDGRTNHGEAAASGVYFYRLSTASGYVEARRMVMLK